MLRTESINKELHISSENFSIYRHQKEWVTATVTVRNLILERRSTSQLTHEIQIGFNHSTTPITAV